MQQDVISIPSGSPGTTSRISVWRYGEPSGQKIYLQAAIHADEWPGLLVLHHLHKRLKASEIYGEIVIVPYANPIGMRQFLGGYQLGRFDFDYSGNFNRGYLNLAQAALPYLNPETLRNVEAHDKILHIRQAMHTALEAWQPQLESEHLRKALQLLSYDADYVIDLHCDAEACAHAFVNHRQQSFGEALAAIMQLDVLILENDLGAMAFDEAAASPWWQLETALGIPLPHATQSATLELRGERDISDSLAQQDAEHLWQFLIHLGFVKGDAPLLQPKNIGTPLAGVARILAPHTGIIDFKIRPGMRVTRQQLIAELIDLDHPDQARTPLYAPTEGIVYALGRNHLVRLGHVVAQIAGNEAQGNGTLAY